MPTNFCSVHLAHFFLGGPGAVKRQNEQQKKCDLRLLGVPGPSFHFIGVMDVMGTLTSQTLCLLHF